MREPEVSSVADYLAQLNQVLAGQSGRVKGEVTSIKPSNKAIYFTIKDPNEAALLDCMMWVSLYQDNGLEFHEGDEVIVTGAPNVYAPFGSFKFKATTIEYAGEGALKRAYEKLKQRLTVEGLFEVERKRLLPDLPKKIGVITSMSGVVIQDFTANLGRRGYKIIAIDSRVEGKDAIHELLASIRTMSKQDIEVLVVMRGGGSWESLQAFNTESVVRAIANFKVPVITGIGHEADVTLAEMVADIGRSTPTAVAEALNESWDGLVESLGLLERRTLGEFHFLLTAQHNLVSHKTSSILRNYEQELSLAKSHMHNTSSHVLRVFTSLANLVRDANNSLLRAAGIMKSSLATKQKDMRRAQSRLNQQFNLSVSLASKSLADNFKQSVRRQSEVVREASRSLSALERTIITNNPKRNMQLGYSLSYINGKLARNIADVKVGKIISTQLVDGEFTSEVKGVK